MMAPDKAQESNLVDRVVLCALQFVRASPTRVSMPPKSAYRT